MAIHCFGLFWFLTFLLTHSLALDDSFKNNIKEIRSQLLKKAEEDSSLFHPDDVKYFKDNDWPILRFLIDTKNDKDKAQERVIKAFSWRNKELPKMDYFPAELHRQRMLITCGQSIAGRPLLQAKVRRVTLVDKLIMLQAKHFTSTFDQLEHQAGEKGVDIMADFEEYGTSLFEPKFVTIINGWLEHFPVSVRSIYMYRFPWYYETLWGLLKPLFAKPVVDAMIFVEDAKQLEKYVKFDQLDKDLGGTNDCKTKLPESVESGICQSKFSNIKEEDWKKFYKEHKETFKAQAERNGYKNVAEMFECKNGNSAANEIIKRVAEN